MQSYVNTLTSRNENRYSPSSKTKTFHSLTQNTYLSQSQSNLFNMNKKKLKLKQSQCIPNMEKNLNKYIKQHKTNIINTAGRIQNEKTSNRFIKNKNTVRLSNENFLTPIPLNTIHIANDIQTTNAKRTAVYFRRKEYSSVLNNNTNNYSNNINNHKKKQKVNKTHINNNQDKIIKIIYLQRWWKLIYKVIYIQKTYRMNLSVKKVIKLKRVMFSVNKIRMILYQKVFTIFVTKLMLIQKSKSTKSINGGYLRKSIGKKAEKTIIPKHSTGLNKKKKLNIYENKLNSTIIIDNSIKISIHNIPEIQFTNKNENCLELISKQIMLIPGPFINKNTVSFILRHKLRKLFYKWKTFHTKLILENICDNQYKFIYNKRSNSCLDIFSENNTTCTNNNYNRAVIKIFKKPKLTSISPMHIKSYNSLYTKQITTQIKQFTFTLFTILHDFLMKRYFSQLKKYSLFNQEEYSIIELNPLNISLNQTLPQIYKLKHIRKHSMPQISNPKNENNNFIYASRKPKGCDNCFSISKKQTAEHTFLNNTVKYNETEIDDNLSIHTTNNNSLNISWKHCNTMTNIHHNDNAGTVNSSFYPKEVPKIKTKVIHFTKKYN